MPIFSTNRYLLPNTLSNTLVSLEFPTAAPGLSACSSGPSGLFGLRHLSETLLSASYQYILSTTYSLRAVRDLNIGRDCGLQYLAGLGRRRAVRGLF